MGWPSVLGDGWMGLFASPHHPLSLLPGIDHLAHEEDRA